MMQLQRTRCVFWPRLLSGLMLCLWLALAAVAAAAPAQPERPPDAAQAETELSEARKQIDEIRERVEDGGEDAQLVRWRADVLDIQSRAETLAEALAPQLASASARLTELGEPPAGGREAPDVAAQRAQVQKDVRALDSQTKLARLLSVEASQTAEQISTLRRTQFQARLGERRDSFLGTPFWSELRGDLPRDLRRLDSLADELSEAAAATPSGIWLALALAIAGVLLLRAGCSRVLVRLTATRVPPGRLRRSFLAVSVVALAVATPGLIAELLHIGLTWRATLSDDTGDLLENLVAVVCFGGYVAGLGYALLSPDRSTWRLPAIHDKVAQGLRHLPFVLGILVVVIWLSDQLPVLLNASLTATITATSLAALVQAIVLAWGLRRWTRLRRRAADDEGHVPPRPYWASVLVTATWIVLATSAISLMAGYAAFGSFIVKQVLWTLAILCSAYLLSVLIEDGFSTLLAPSAQDEDDVRNRLRGQAAVLLSGIARVAVVLFAATLLLAPFGEGPNDLLHRLNQLHSGLQIGEVHVRPGAVMQALLVLALCLVGVRLLKRWLSSRYLPTTELDPGMQMSAATLFGYAGFVVAVALALSALGIGLERVAWIASALSVGIGFGLQAVVQNFVSGLILLAERPVKVGDWVSLGGVEGDIQRINVRATEIQMADRSTVIVPNSEFVTKTVRNVTHSNPLGVVQVKLPMPLDADAQRVRELMLEAFAAHEGILDNPEPDVFLEGVENGHLMFNGRGFVSTPRNAYGVRSALLYDILQRMTAAGLPLASSPTMVLARPSARGGRLDADARDTDASAPAGPSAPGGAS
ncbi:DUF3772 domain-containing protein [Bordetella petrii]|uniref:DUF3772 domain-containing protein n=1 Tax=Bordetella petrii TaxID=94624 RepID=UPI001E4BAD5E|nr:DUF3772 domain-containing protein [Bordetella petrii]MCD0503264.1 DUF3772 domain-containing protein [Bordetella petrii]